LPKDDTDFKIVKDWFDWFCRAFQKEEDLGMKFSPFSASVDSAVKIKIESFKDHTMYEPISGEECA
jgi:hypothetical protein